MNNSKELTSGGISSVRFSITDTPQQWGTTGTINSYPLSTEHHGGITKDQFHTALRRVSPKIHSPKSAVESK